MILHRETCTNPLSLRETLCPCDSTSLYTQVRISLLSNMLWHKTRSLPLRIHALCNLAFKVPSSRRRYCVHPPPPPSSTPTPTNDEPIDKKGNLQMYFAKSFETVPYTNRTRRILYPRDIEMEYAESLFNELKEKLTEDEGMLLSPTHPDVVWVKMIFNNIIDALQRDLKKMGNATSSYESIMARILMSLSRKTPPASTSHLVGLDWEILVVKYDPNIPHTTFRYSVTDGKKQQIVVSHDLVNLFVGRDIELAIIISQVVARNVARHKGERLTKEMWIKILSNFLGENVAKHIGLRILRLIRRLPFNKRLNEEAEHIGLLLLTSAGYDPQEAAKANKNMGKSTRKECIKLF